MECLGNKTEPCSSEPISVAIAECSWMGSQLLESVLKRSRQKFRVHAFAGASDETIHELRKTQPSVAVVSSQLKDGALSGFKVLHQLQQSAPKTAPIMLLDTGDRDLVIEAFRTGARAVFTRGHSISDLPKCIRAVHQGEPWLNIDQVELLLELVRRTTPPQTVYVGLGGMASLRLREQEIVRLVAEGMKNDEIAEKLNLTEHTVRNYVSSIFDKLGMSSRVELVLYALSR